MSARASIPDAIAEEAALWVVRLSAGDAAERAAAQAGLDAWMRQSPAHEAAVNHLRQVVDSMQGLRGEDAASAGAARAGFEAAFVHAGKKRARRLLLSAGAFLLAATVAWTALQGDSLPYLMADARSATGEWRSQVLEDGTQVTLASNSAINLRFDARRRELELVRGEVLVNVAKDASRPFVVSTPEARLTALGTRYVVERREDVTILTVIESRVRVETAGGGEGARAAATPALVVEAGQRVVIARSGAGKVETIDPRKTADAWKHHHLVVRDRPLTDVLDELGRYRPGRIFYDRAALAGVRMVVVLPLDDTDQALRLLQESVPGLTLTFLTPYLVWVGRSAPVAAR